MPELHCQGAGTGCTPAASLRYLVGKNFVSAAQKLHICGLCVWLCIFLFLIWSSAGQENLML